MMKYIGNKKDLIITGYTSKENLTTNSDNREDSSPPPPKVTIHRLAGAGIEALDENDYTGAREVLSKIQDKAGVMEV